MNPLSPDSEAENLISTRTLPEQSSWLPSNGTIWLQFCRFILSLLDYLILCEDSQADNLRVTVGCQWRRHGARSAIPTESISVVLTLPMA
jgi:hypothetical protein